jgi:hypothetical protein
VRECGTDGMVLGASAVTWRAAEDRSESLWSGSLNMCGWDMLKRGGMRECVCGGCVRRFRRKLRVFLELPKVRKFGVSEAGGTERAQAASGGVCVVVREVNERARARVVSGKRRVRERWILLKKMESCSP